MIHDKYRGADKSLARPGMKQAYSDQTLTFASHKKKIRNLSVQPGLHGSNVIHVGRKMATFQLFFFSRVGLKTYQHPYIQIWYVFYCPITFQRFKVSLELTKQENRISRWR